MPITDTSRGRDLEPTPERGAISRHAPERTKDHAMTRWSVWAYHRILLASLGTDRALANVEGVQLRRRPGLVTPAHARMLGAFCRVHVHRTHHQSLWRRRGYLMTFDARRRGSWRGWVLVLDPG